jgi:hypothetical protein
MDGVKEAGAQALLEKAAAYRRLALEILDGPFRRELVDLANDYARRAASMEAQIGDGKQRSVLRNKHSSS